MGLGYIAAYVKQHVPDCAIEVFSQAFDSDDEIIRQCEDADIVGFGCTTPQIKSAIELTARIKLVNPGVYVVFGGYAPTALPFETKELPGVDKVIVGEGENGMLATVRGNRMNVLLSEQISDLDNLPFPDRKFIKAERHVEVAQKETGKRITSVQASRGCPFRCLPCSNINMHGANIRVRTPQLIIEEMQKIKAELNLDFIKFCDATFNTSIERTLEFCREAKSLNLDVPWGCNIHPSIVTQTMFLEMAQANCQEVWIGAESGSPKILREMRKATTPETIKNAFKWAKEAGLLRRAYFLIGSPSEDAEDIKLTETLAEEIDADSYGMTILCPYPGTELYDAKAYSGVDWSLADEYNNTFWRNKAFTNQELWKIRETLTEKFKDRLVWKLKQ